MTGATEKVASLFAAIVAKVKNEVLAEVRAELKTGRQARHWPEWMGSETSAQYLGDNTERLRKLVAERAIPFVQEGAGCRVFFERRAFDAWMCSQEVA